MTGHPYTELNARRVFHHIIVITLSAEARSSCMSAKAQYVLMWLIQAKQPCARLQTLVPSVWASNF